MKCVLVDDEKKSRVVLSKLLKTFCPDVTVLGEAESVQEAYDLIIKAQPQLVFLDIQMPTGTGFSLLRRFKPVNFEVIFVTSFDKYAINAIKFNALDYLMKPVEVDDLVQAVKRAQERIRKKIEQTPQIINLINSIEDCTVERRIAVHQNEKVLLIPVSDICFIESDDRYSNIHLIEGQKYLVSKTLKDFEEYLADNPLLVRIGKSAIININCVKDYSKGEPCVIQLNNGRSFEISRRKKQSFLERLKK
jgi:two-component system, LytTR family, response regulator